MSALVSPRSTFDEEVDAALRAEVVNGLAGPRPVPLSVLAFRWRKRLRGRLGHSRRRLVRGVHVVDRPVIGGPLFCTVPSRNSVMPATIGDQAKYAALDVVPAPQRVVAQAIGPDSGSKQPGPLRVLVPAQRPSLILPM